MTHVFLNNGFIPESDARISVFDRGFLYGDGIFETMKTENGKVEFLEDHLERLKRSAGELDIPVPDTEWEKVISQLIEENDLKGTRARVKIILTRGVQKGLSLKGEQPPTLIITAVEQAHRKKPETIGIYPVKRMEPIAKYKSMNYLFNLIARDWAQKNGYDEAVLLGPGGEMLECSTSNIFVKQGNTIIKPLNEGYYLEGIMGRHFMQKQEDKGIEVKEKKIFPDDIKDTDTVYITNSMIGICAVSLAL